MHSMWHGRMPAGGTAHWPVFSTTDSPSRAVQVSTRSAGTARVSAGSGPAARRATIVERVWRRLPAAAAHALGVHQVAPTGLGMAAGPDQRSHDAEVAVLVVRGAFQHS